MQVVLETFTGLVAFSVERTDNNLVSTMYGISSTNFCIHNIQLLRRLITVRRIFRVMTVSSLLEIERQVTVLRTKLLFSGRFLLRPANEVLQDVHQ